MYITLLCMLLNRDTINKYSYPRIQIHINDGGGDSVQTVISSEGNPDESSEDFLAMDPLAAQALKDLKQALGLAVQVEDFMSAATLKKIEPKIRKIGEALAVQQNNNKKQKKKKKKANNNNNNKQK